MSYHILTAVCSLHTTNAPACNENVTLPKVTIYPVPSDLPYGSDGAAAKFNRDGDGTEAQFKTYLTFPATLGQKYDLILDDGRARLEVR